MIRRVLLFKRIPPVSQLISKFLRNTNLNPIKYKMMKFEAISQKKYYFSTSGPNSEDLSESQFHVIADVELEDILDSLEILEDDDSLGDDIDINYAMGVMNINLGKHGTWVINKQTPNRQLWWSSPISGPRRYELIDNKWYNTRNNNNNDNNNNDTLKIALLKELSEKTGINL